MKKMRISAWVVDLVTVISGVISIASPIAGLIVGLMSKEWANPIAIALIVGLVAFAFVCYNKVRKYRRFSNDRMKVMTGKYLNSNQHAKTLYYEVMKQYKEGGLSLQNLTNQYKSTLSDMLDDLSEIMKSLTGKDVSACIKLITYDNYSNEVVDLDNTRLITFSRSTDPGDNRGHYELNRPILLKENSDFMEIVDEKSRSNYFYQRDLREYARRLERVGKRYENSNPDWKSEYIGTICVPIWSRFHLLYHQQRNDNAYHIIGFLCVDSLSSDAFLEKQEMYNVNMVKSFSELFYILLGQYKYYLTKIELG